MPNTQRESNRGNDLKSDGLAKANLNDQDAGFTQKKEIISKIQEHLISQGLYPGPADGVSSLLFEDAVRSYQTTHNLQPTGRATESLLLHIETMALGPRKFIQ